MLGLNRLREDKTKRLYPLFCVQKKYIAGSYLPVVFKLLEQGVVRRMENQASKHGKLGKDVTG